MSIFGLEIWEDESPYSVAIDLIRASSDDTVDCAPFAVIYCDETWEVNSEHIPKDTRFAVMFLEGKDRQDILQKICSRENRICISITEEIELHDDLLIEDAICDYCGEINFWFQELDGRIIAQCKDEKCEMHGKEIHIDTIE
jgi:hypothetical protein